MSAVPLMRRYWLCGSAALDALETAIDPPDWAESDVPTTIVCLDEAALLACRPLAEGAHVQLVDGTEPGGIAALAARLLASDHARYFQLCTCPVVDFAPAVELLRERLERDAPAMLRGEIVHVGPTATWFGAVDRLWRDPAGAPLRAALAPEGAWIEAGLLRAVLAGAPLYEANPATVMALVLRAGEMANEVGETSLIIGARFIAADADEGCRRVALDALGANADPLIKAAVRADSSGGRYVVDDLALDEAGIAQRLESRPPPPSEWRARTAAALARVDWLEVDRDHRWIRGQARKRKAERDEERRRAELAAEIATLRAQLGGPMSPARWKLRRERAQRSRLAKVLRRWV